MAAAVTDRVRRSDARPLALSAYGHSRSASYSRLCSRPVTALIDLCLTELSNFTGPDHEQEDDITLVSLQRSPSAWHQERIR